VLPSAFCYTCALTSVIVRQICLLVENRFSFIRYNYSYYIAKRVETSQATSMSDTLTKLAYETFQQGKSYFGLAHKTISSQLLNLISPPVNELKTKPIEPKLLLEIHHRLNQIIETDWQDAQRGVSC
jgi:hypothetical protein